MSGLPCIHLIERNDRLRPHERGSAIYESGYWAVTEETAARLVGGTIYFHRTQASPAFFGGQIQAWRVEHEGQWQGRVVFTFQAEQACKGVKARPGGWGNEKKLVWPAGSEPQAGAWTGRSGVDCIVKTLAAAKRRATYGALGEVVGLPARSVMAGREVSEANSWIVSADTGLPTGYPDSILNDARRRGDEVLSTAGDLLAWLRARRADVVGE